jgi:UDP-glucose 4-epimerase
VADLAQAHILAMRAIDEKSRVYNLGIGQGFSVKQVIDAARKITGHAIPTKMGARRPGDPAVLIAGSEKIRRELDWKPRFTNLDDIVQSAWNWHQKHPQGYGKS